VLAKEQELDSIGHQAAAAAHSLGTPLSTITVIAKELKKEVKDNPKYSDDVDVILSEVKRCGEILKKLSKREIVDDIYVSNVALEDLLFEIKNSFEEISKKSIQLYFDKKNKKTPIKRSPELTYGIRNFVGNAVKFSKENVTINLINDEDEIKIRISDDGPGFPNDVFKIIGEPYIASKIKKI
jgi:Signal transduction histidine kinase